MINKVCVGLHLKNGQIVSILSLSFFHINLYIKRNALFSFFHLFEWFG